MATTAAVSSGSRFCRDCGGPVTNREELAWCVNTVPKASAERYRLGPGFFASTAAAPIPALDDVRVAEPRRIVRRAATFSSEAVASGVSARNESIF